MKRHSANPQESMRSGTKRIMITRYSSRHAYHRSRKCLVWLRVRRDTPRMVGAVGKIIKGWIPSNPVEMVWDRSFLAGYNRCHLIKDSLRLWPSRQCPLPASSISKVIRCSNRLGGRRNIQGMAWVPTWPYFPPRARLTWQVRSDLTVRSLPTTVAPPHHQRRMISRRDRKLNRCHARRHRTRVTYQRWCPKLKLSKLHPS